MTGVGAGPLPEGNMLHAEAFWEDASGGNAHNVTLRLCAGNAVGRMSAMWNQQRHSSLPDCRRGASERPALGIRDQEVAENLYACNRFKFFRIDKVGVERERVLLAEQLHQPAVFLDQIIRQ